MATTAPRAAVSFTVEQEAMRQLGQAFRHEADGKALRKDLTKSIREAVQPGVSAVKSKLSSIPHSASARPAPRLSTYLAARVKVEVKYSGKRTGVRVKIGQTPQLRNFKLAAKYLNKRSWRHPVFGDREVWVTQQSHIPGFFDETLAEGKDEYRAAVVEALGDMARRLIARAR